MQQDPEYLEKVFNAIGGNEKGYNYGSFVNRMSSDSEYNQKVFDAIGGNEKGYNYESFTTRTGLVKKKGGDSPSGIPSTGSMTVDFEASDGIEKQEEKATYQLGTGVQPTETPQFMEGVVQRRPEPQQDFDRFMVTPEESKKQERIQRTPALKNLFSDYSQEDIEEVLEQPEKRYLGGKEILTGGRARTKDGSVVSFDDLKEKEFGLRDFEQVSDKEWAELLLEGNDNAVEYTEKLIGFGGEEPTYTSLEVSVLPLALQKSTFQAEINAEAERASRIVSTVTDILSESIAKGEASIKKAYADASTEIGEQRNVNEIYYEQGTITEEQYKQNKARLDEIEANIVPEEYKVALRQQANTFNALAALNAEYDDRTEGKSNVGKGIVNSLLVGLNDIVIGAAQTGYDGLTWARYFASSIENAVNMVSVGAGFGEVFDPEKRVVLWDKDKVVDAADLKLGTLGYQLQDEEELKQSLGTVGGTLYEAGTGLAASLPAMALGGYGLFAQAYANGYRDAREMGLDPQSATIYGTTLGLVQAKLEQVGLRNLISSKSVIGSLVNRSLRQVVGGKQNIIRALDRAVNSEVKSFAGTAAKRLSSGFLSEFETGSLQALSESSLQYVTNLVTGRDVFKDIDFSASTILRSGLLEGIGGAYMGSINVFSGRERHNFSGFSDSQIEMFRSALTDPKSKLSQQYLSYLNQQFQLGNMSEAEYGRRLNNFRNARNVFSQVPSEYSNEDAGKAADLLQAKRAIEAKLKRYPEMPLKKDRDALARINQELDKIDAKYPASEGTQEAVELEQPAPAPVEFAAEDEATQGQFFTREVDGETVIFERLEGRDERQLTAEEAADVMRYYEQMEAGAAPPGISKQQLDEGVAKLFEEAQQEMGVYLSEMRLADQIDPMIERMNNGEYIADTDVDAMIDMLMTEVERVSQDENMSEATRQAVADNLLNLAEEIDNYELRTKTQTRQPTEAESAQRTRKATYPTTAERFFDLAEGQFNGQDAFFTVNEKGQVVIQDRPTLDKVAYFEQVKRDAQAKIDGELKRKPGETTAALKKKQIAAQRAIDMALTQDAATQPAPEQVLDIATLGQPEITIGEDGNFESITLTDKDGNTITLTGERGLDLAIKARMDAVGQVPDAVFESTLEEETIQYRKKPERDAFPEQETRDISDAERAEGVQEVEEEVRKSPQQEEADLINLMREQELSLYSDKQLNVPVGDTGLTLRETINQEYDGLLADAGVEPISLTGLDGVISLVENIVPDNQISPEMRPLKEFINGLNQKGRNAVKQIAQTIRQQAASEADVKDIIDSAENLTDAQKEQLSTLLNELPDMQPGENDPSDTSVRDAEAVGASPFGYREMYKEFKTKFGLSNKQAKFAAIIADKMITTMAKRAGISKLEMYKRIIYKKGVEADLPQGVLFQLAAWHGSPYQFDKFTTEAIGTGEGAQAFGWGLYFTDVESIAKNYADILSRSKVLEDEFSFTKEGEDLLRHAYINGMNNATLEEVLKSYYEKYPMQEPLPRDEEMDIYGETYEDVISYRKLIEDTYNKRKDEVSSKLSELGRNLYRVNLQKGKTPDQYTFLEWDSPVDYNKVYDSISKQLVDEGILTQEQVDEIPLIAIENEGDAKGFIRALQKADIDLNAATILFRVINNHKGKALYNSITDYFLYKNKLESRSQAQKQASLFLLRSGIDGIKYPAESISRGATTDTARGSNYVVFDENAVSIEEAIKFQRDAVEARGAMMMTLDGRAIIYALTNPNVSTPLHELAHVYEHYLSDAERKQILKWAGHKTWTVETSEKFARGFERFLAEPGGAPKSVQRYFESFKKWLMDIYGGLIGSLSGSDIDVGLNEEMARIYTEMLGEDFTIEQEAHYAVKRAAPALFDSEGNPVTEATFGTSSQQFWGSLRRGRLGRAWQAWSKSTSNTLNGENGFIALFRQRMSQVSTMTKMMDGVNKSNFFTDKIYKPLLKATETYMKGKRSQTRKLDKLANSIDGVKGGFNGIIKLLSVNDMTVLSYDISKGAKSGIRRNTFSADQLARIYALSKNKDQRRILRKMGFNDAAMSEIEGQLGPEVTEFVDKVVEYLSSDYFGTVNSVYSNITGESLNQIENYFPTKKLTSKSITGQDIKETFKDDFDGMWQSALQDRVDKNTDIDIDQSFTGVLMNHFDSMEHFKAFAVEVDNISKILDSETVKVWMRGLGINNILRTSLIDTVNPTANQEVTDRIFPRAYRNLISSILMMPVQIPRQMASFLTAFAKYKGGFLEFMYDYAAVVSNLPKWLKFLRENSAMFDERMRNNLSGNGYLIETGGRKFVPSSLATRGKRRYYARAGQRKVLAAAGIFTTVGDALGIMGYAANMRKNLREGMSLEQAINEFNEYDATQQSQTTLNKVSYQKSGNVIVRTGMAFSSSIISLMNVGFRGANGIWNSVKNGDVNPNKWRKEDIRSFFIGYLGSNFLYALVNQFSKLVGGDEEDRKDAMFELAYGLSGLNSAERIPILGEAINQIKGITKASLGLGEYNPYKTGGQINHMAEWIRRIEKASKDEKYLELIKVAIAMNFGVNVDPAIGAYNFVETTFGKGGVKSLDDAMDILRNEDFYEAIGLSKSYRPKLSKGDSPSYEESGMNEDLYDLIYGD